MREVENPSQNFASKGPEGVFLIVEKAIEILNVKVLDFEGT